MVFGVPQFSGNIESVSDENKHSNFNIENFSVPQTLWGSDTAVAYLTLRFEHKLVQSG